MSEYDRDELIEKAGGLIGAARAEQQHRLQYDRDTLPPPVEQERPDPERVVVSRRDAEVLLNTAEKADTYQPGGLDPDQEAARDRLDAALSQTPDGSAQTGGEER